MKLLKKRCYICNTPQFSISQSTDIDKYTSAILIHALYDIDNCVLQVTSGTSFLHLILKYCPNCGRKLKKKGEKNGI